MSQPILQQVESQRKQISVWTGGPVEWRGLINLALSRCGINSSTAARACLRRTLPYFCRAARGLRIFATDR